MLFCIHAYPPYNMLHICIRTVLLDSLSAYARRRGPRNKVLVYMTLFLCQYNISNF